ncbi:MAG TPA: hypothetical protein VI451_07330 [Anaerolineales bacterium]|nr:hypothetical protein [Anaerolineales bacterium]
MRKRTFFLILIPILLLACQTLNPIGGVSSPVAATPPTSTPLSAGPPRVDTLTPTAIPSPTGTPTPSATPTLSLPTLSPLEGLSETDFSVRYHPDGALFVGDQISFEVIAPPDVNLDGREVVISLEGAEIARGGFGGFGIGGRKQATFWWSWNTTGLKAGDHTLTYAVTEGPTWTDTVTLLPASAYLFPEPDAVWATAESDCCVYYYVTGTEAERDLATLMDTADAQADSALAKIGGEFDEPIEVVFMPRVLGHGGFAGGEIYISYLDRNYAGNAPAQVLHHEMVHILDGRAGGDLRPTMFVEGLAVYLSGGHFKQEPLISRAAEMVDLGWFLPLGPLADDFYNAQHEISYLEAASLIEFMVEKWGWEAFNDFYRDIHTHPSNLQSAAINQALSLHFEITLDQLEAQFLEALNKMPDGPALEDDVRLSVSFFDTVRRYQQALDTSAYFLTAWLPGITEMRDRGIVADYVRHPSEPDNLALETLMVEADAALRAGDYAETDQTLRAVNSVLDAYAAGDLSPFYADPLAADYFAIVEAALAAGYTPEKIVVSGGTAIVWGKEEGVELVEVDLVREEEGWKGE